MRLWKFEIPICFKTLFQFTFARYFVGKKHPWRISSAAVFVHLFECALAKQTNHSGGHVDQRENTSSIVYTENFEDIFSVVTKSYVNI